MKIPGARRAGRVPAPPGGVVSTIQSFLGAAMLACGAWLLWDFPISRPWLFGLALLVATAQWLDARSWLIAVPLLFAVVDLGAWSGRFLLSEQDALLAILVGVALVRGHFRASAGEVFRLAFAPLWLLLVALAVGFTRGLQPLAELDANAWNGYLTTWNALRVAKGPAWALVLWPLLARQLADDREATEARLALGMAAALVGFGVFVLWERGLAWDLMRATNIWELFGTWLNLSASYRITGPFSQMHVGGEAVDGFLVLAWPFALILMLQARGWPLSLLGLVAVALAAYGVMVTFTRTTYVAVAIAFLAFAAAALAGAPTRHRPRLVWVALYVAVAAVVFVHGFRLGGTLAMAGYLSAALFGLGAGMYVQWRKTGVMAAGGLLSLLTVGALIAVRGMVGSKWSDVDMPTAVAVAAASALLLGGGGLAIGAVVRLWASARARLILLLLLAVFLPALTLSLTNFRMEERFSSVRADLDSRLAHWRHVLALLPNDAETAALGLGLGRFPLENHLAADKPLGAWFLPREDSRNFLRLTGGICYGQRVVGLEPGTYRVEVELRSPSQHRASLAVKLQPRRLLESEHWQPQTKQFNLAAKPGGVEWQRLSGELRLDGGALPPWYDPRFAVFVLANEGADGSVLEVREVRLIDSQRRDRLVNGTFASGGDRWFGYDDFGHLEWHAKNFYVALFFDMGLVGLLAWVASCLVALVRSSRHARAGSLFGAAATAALVGFLILGVTGTLLDVPQLMTLVLLIIIAATWGPRHPKGITGLRRPKATG